MKKKEPRRTFTREFKLEAVRQVVERGRALVEVARELDIHASLLSVWKRELLADQVEAFPGRGRLKPSEEEYRQLERENRFLRQGVEFPKNSSVLREGPIARFLPMQIPRDQYSLAVMCCALEVSPSGYHAYCRRPSIPRALEDQLLIQQLRLLPTRTRRAYGSPRMRRALVKRGHACGRLRIARLMRENDLAARRKKRFRRTIDSKRRFPIAPNLLQRHFSVAAPNRAWASDVTYIWTREGWLYFAATLYLY